MTKKRSTARKNQHPWSSDALLAKSQRYAQEMLAVPSDDWRFGLASTFVLEFLARAALAKVSPALLADQKDWKNVYFSLDRTPIAPKFIARSIDITSVFQRLKEIIPSFTTEQEGFASQHVNRRNEELHTGSTPFESVKADWLPAFYQTCQVLLESLGKNLKTLIGVDEAKVAAKLISASQDDSAKAVKKAIESHKTAWETKDNSEKAKAALQASAWAIRQMGHRVTCPACGSDALVSGTPVSEPKRKLDGNIIVETQQYLPAKFECVACLLKVAGLSRLAASGLAARFTHTKNYDAAEYFAPDDQYAGFDDDNNEYGEEF